jgi:hypothetical protein
VGGGKNFDSPIQAAFLKEKGSLSVLITLSEIWCFSPARDLRLGAFGRAFRVYMSILGWNECCQDHYVFTRFRPYSRLQLDVVDPGSRRHQDSTTNLYILGEILISQQKWKVATDGVSKSLT